VTSLATAGEREAPFVKELLMKDKELKKIFILTILMFLAMC
jgi:hypothetical protein